MIVDDVKKDIWVKWRSFGDVFIIKSKNGTKNEKKSTKEIPIFGLSDKGIFAFNGDKTTDGELIPDHTLIKNSEWENIMPDKVKDGDYVIIHKDVGSKEGMITIGKSTVRIYNSDYGHPSDVKGYEFYSVIRKDSIYKIDTKELIKCPCGGNPAYFGICKKCCSEFKICLSCQSPCHVLTKGYCFACKDEKLKKCDTCHELILPEEIVCGDFCTVCAKEYCTKCETCGEWMNENCLRCDAPTIGESIPVIKPRGSGNVFMGIELEVECGNKDQQQAAVIMKRKWNYLKHDGSLKNGIELVTQPLSYGWIYENAEEFKGLFLKLIKNGVRSYDTTSCGIHIHLSKKEEDGEEITDAHFYNILKIIYSNPEFTLAISQRRKTELVAWANCFPEGHDYHGGSNRENISRIREMAKGKFCSEQKFQAIRVTANTMEFRIFKGTLNFASFMKNVDFVWSVYQYSKDCTDTSAKSYVEWVITQDYPYLKAWLIDNSAIIEKVLQCKPITGEIPQLSFTKSDKY